MSALRDFSAYVYESFSPPFHPFISPFVRLSKCHGAVVRTDTVSEQNESALWRYLNETQKSLAFINTALSKAT